MGADSSKDAPQNFSELRKKSKYTIKELKAWHSNFLVEHPHGYLTMSEFDEAYCKCFPKGNGSLFAEQAFRIFDQNSDGKIEFRELAIALGVAGRGKMEEKIQWMFSLYDINNDGYVRKDEMRKIIRSMFRMVTDVVYAQTADAAAEKLTQDIYRDLDKNNDGRLSLQEFVQLGNSNKLLMDIFGVGMEGAVASNVCYGE